MFALLRTLPVVLVLVIGLAGGSAVTGGLSWAWLTLIHDPAVRRETKALLTVEVQRASDAATAAEQLRQFRIGEAATQKYIEQKAADDAAQQAQVDEMQKEIVDYERDKAAAGDTTCRLTQRDLDFLGGVQHH